MYKIYGDYALNTEQLLEEFPLLSEAERWAKRYCRNDLGGYFTIEVVSFRNDGEAVTHWRCLDE